MRDPFKIDGPTCISFSGGRTSAYMLWRVLQSNGGLPTDAVVAFANTGKEDEATLRFVRDCGQNWGVPITWVEYRNDEAGFAVVDFDTASRNGEPFEAIIRKRNYLPNPVTRFCTSELKIRVMHKWLRTMGWSTEDMPVDMMTGIRADEPRRVAKIRARGTTSESKHAWMVLPLADAGVTVQEVSEFWAQQLFDLELPTYNGRTLAGNCDLCFLKPTAQIASLIAEKPERAKFWVRIEEYAKSIQRDPQSQGIRFRWDRPSYAAMLAFTQAQSDAFGYADDGIECVGCTD